MKKNRFFESCVLLMGTLLLLGCPSMVSAIYPSMPVIFPGTTGAGVVLATDENNRAIAIYEDIGLGNLIRVEVFSNNIWHDLPPPNVMNGTTYGLAMEPSGTALIIVQDNILAQIQTAYFNGQTWVTPSPNPMDTSDGTGGTAVAMNGPGSGVGIWVDAGSNIRVAFFLNGNWGAPVTIGTGSRPQIAFSTDGTAIAGWVDSASQVVLSNYIGGVWSAPVVFITPFGQLAGVGIDAQGKGLALGKNTTAGPDQGKILAARFDGTNWLPPQELSVQLPDNFIQLGALSMSPNGTAVAVWQYNNTFFNFYHLYYAQFDGNSWAPTVDFQPQPAIGNAGPGVSVNGNGDALLTFSFVPGELLFAQLPLGGTLSAPQFLFAAMNVFGNPSFATNGFSMIAGTFGPFEFPIPFAFAAILPGVSGPLKGKTCKSNFASQTDRVNTITWGASGDPNVVAYRLQRNGVIIATISAKGPLIYRDHNRCKKGDIYTLQSVDFDGVPSDPMSIQVK